MIGRQVTCCLEVRMVTTVYCVYGKMKMNYEVYTSDKDSLKALAFTSAEDLTA